MTIVDYLNLWKSRDNKDKYFNDYMMLTKINQNIQNLDDLEVLIKGGKAPAFLSKPRDVSVSKNSV